MVYLLVAAEADPLRWRDRDGKRTATEPVRVEAQRSTRANEFFESEAAARSRDWQDRRGKNEMARVLVAGHFP
jgi:hypothetical protein